MNLTVVIQECTKITLLLTAQVFQKEIVYMKTCCIYEKQYAKSYIVHYRFLIFLNRIFPHLPFTSILEKRFFSAYLLHRWATQRNYFSLPVVSLVKFVVKLVTNGIYYDLMPKFIIACGQHRLWAACRLNGMAEASDESPGDAGEIWKWGVGIGHTTVVYARQIKTSNTSFVLCDISVEGWYEFASFSTAVVLPLLSLKCKWCYEY